LSVPAIPIIDIQMAEFKAIVKPDGVADDVAWKSMALLRIHWPILTNAASLVGSTYF
jgi:hypothetical protein